MKTKAFLETQRLYLRPLMPSDVEGPYGDWFSDEEVCRYNSHHRFPVDKEALIEYIQHSNRTKERLVLGVFQKEGEKHIGNISLQCIDFLSRSAEFAILIGDKEVWGQGFSKEAGKALIDHGIQALNLRRIYCGVHEENEGMKALALALGMVEEGRRREAVFKNGKYSDFLEYGGIYE